MDGKVILSSSRIISNFMNYYYYLNFSALKFLDGTIFGNILNPSLCFGFIQNLIKYIAKL